METTQAMTITIWHNPRCSKSRRALEILNDLGLRPTVVEYLKTPPQPKELRDVLRRLDMAPRDLMRTREAPWRDLGLGDAELSDDVLIRAMHEHPILIERPVVQAGDRAVLGRPPERVLDLVGDQRTVR